MCRIRHALPRIFIRLWSVRNSCARAAQVTRCISQSRTRQPSIHDRGLFAQRSRTRIGRIREHSASAACSRRRQRQKSVREQATALCMDSQPAGNQRDLATSAFKTHPRMVCDLCVAGECPRPHAEFPIHRQSRVRPHSKSLPSHVFI